MTRVDLGSCLAHVTLEYCAHKKYNSGESALEILNKSWLCQLQQLGSLIMLMCLCFF